MVTRELACIKNIDFLSNIVEKKIENCIKPVERCLILLQNNCLDLSMKVKM